MTYQTFRYPGIFAKVQKAITPIMWKEAPMAKTGQNA